MEVGAHATRLCIAIAISLASLSCMYTSNGQGNFLSIDCGGDRNYSDANNIAWIPDSNTDGIDGKVWSVSPPAYVRSNDTPLSSIRFFPGNHSKYCYVFDKGIDEGQPYLIRASFWAGSGLPYPTKVHNSVSFKLLIYADEWDTVSITFPQTSVEVNKEIYVFALRGNVEVCLSGSMIEGSDVPFISSLVLRPLSKLLHPLNFSIYHQNSRPLVTVSRRNYGARNSSEYLRYSGSDSEGYSDVYDRIWEPDTDGTPLVTTQRTDFGLGTDNVPISVMQTARADNESFSLRFNVTAGSWYFYCQYFAEISPDVNGPGQRVFENADKNYSYTYKNTYDSYKDFQLYSTLLVYASHGIYVDFPPKFEVQLIRSNTSINGPIINAIEVFRYLNKDLSLGTINQEVSVVTTITESFGGLRSWNGDPCLPYAYNWLACSSDERPSINEMYGIISAEITAFFLWSLVRDRGYLFTVIS